MDTFQPGVVLHLCYTVVGLKQHQQHGCRVLILIISIYSTDDLELQPVTDYFSDTVALLRPWRLGTVNTGFKGLDV